MKTTNRSLQLLAVSLIVLSTSQLHAQSQPSSAVNQQDEVVSIHLSPNQGPDDVLEILRSDDKFETNSYVSRAYELHNTTAYELKTFIVDAVGAEKGVLRAAATKPKDGGPVRYFIVVTTTKEQLPYIEETIRALDVPGFVNSQGRSRVALRTKYRSASELGNILRATRLTGQAKVFADDLTNTLYYDDSAYVTDALRPYVEFFDVPIPQIEFDVQIIEVKEDNVGKVGLDWDAWKRSIGGQFGLTANSFEGGDTFARLDSLLTLDANVLANFLSYTVQSGNANLVQRSRLNASNLEPAVISDLRRVAFYDYTRTEKDPKILTEKNPCVDSARELERDETPGSDRVITITAPVHNRLVGINSDEEGLFVSIRPVISTETVTAQIDIALNTVTGFDQQDRPIVTEQNLGNRFTLHNNHQILLGTLERESVIKGRRGIPGLKDIPVAKYLFSVETTRSDRSRLFILATPTYSEVGFNAKTLDDLKQNISTLKIEERDLILEDGQPQAAILRTNF